MPGGVSASTGTVHGEHRWDHVLAAIYDRMMSGATNGVPPIVAPLVGGRAVKA